MTEEVKVVLWKVAVCGYCLIVLLCCVRGFLNQALNWFEFLIILSSIIPLAIWISNRIDRKRMNEKLFQCEGYLNEFKEQISWWEQDATEINSKEKLDLLCKQAIYIMEDLDDLSRGMVLVFDGAKKSYRQIDRANELLHDIYKSAMYIKTKGEQLRKKNEGSFE